MTTHTNNQPAASRLLAKDNTMDKRHYISASDGGAYFVRKKYIIAQFRWGKTGNFDCAASAKKALDEWLAGRKDRDRLHVTVLEFKE